MGGSITQVAEGGGGAWGVASHRGLKGGHGGEQLSSSSLTYCSFFLSECPLLVMCLKVSTCHARNLSG